MSYLAQFAERCGSLAGGRISGEKFDAFLNGLVKLMDIKQTALSTCGASHSEAMILFTALDYFADNGKNITVAETARRLNVSMPSVSRSLKALSEKGLIERDLNENDRRSVRVVVTKTGEEKLQGLIKRVYSTLSKTLEVFSDEELLQMIELHNRFVNSLIDTLSKEKGE